MKKVFLTKLLLIAAVLLSAQENFNKLRYMQNHHIPMDPALAPGNHVFPKSESPVVYNKSGDVDVVIGETRYDLQSPNSMQNRIYHYPDQDAGAVWTMGFEDGSGFSDKGTGYNYFKDWEWGLIPAQRLESVETAFPSYAPFGENGEIVAAHDMTGRIVFNRRENKGEGQWNEFFFEGPEGDPGICFNQMITTGENHDTIHLLTITTPVDSGGTLYAGQDGALLYSRSPNGGESWDILHQIIEGTDSSYFTGHEPLVYAWAYPREQTIAFVLFDGVTDGIIMKSTDAGDNWEKIEFFDSPWDGGPLPDSTGKFGGGDGSNAIAIDNYDNAHVVFGRLCRKYVEGIEQWYPYSNGVVYWNEEKEEILDTTKVGSDVGEAEWLEDNGYLIGKIEYIDSLETDYASYYCSATSMVQLQLNTIADKGFVFYSKMTKGYDYEEKNHRHIWMTYFLMPFEGLFGQYIADYTADVFHLQSECVFPSHAFIEKWDYTYLLGVYQTDHLPGIASNYHEHDYVDNEMVWLPVIIAEYPRIDEINSKHTIKVSQNAPNPFSEKTLIEVNTGSSAPLSLTVRDLPGKVILEFDKGTVARGRHTFEIDGSDLNSGIYLYTVTSGNQSQTKKMIVQ
ncbi:MAG: T9SS type A sorting domain-containing protein [Bacteroidales bacterium]|nr:T9SS type A sorting domain-containing protein [Bacteroidales bacterium]